MRNILIFGLSTLLSIASTNVLAANSIQDRNCRSQLDVKSPSKELAQLSCFKLKMADVLQTKRDKKKLDGLIVHIRGNWKVGTGIKNKCKEASLADKTTGGACSGHWNASLGAWSEFSRMHCTVGLSRWNEGVNRERDSAKAHRKKYNACFDSNIPAELDEEFGITNRLSFIDKYKGIAKEADKIQSRWKAASQGCNATLVYLADKYPDIVKSRKLSCKVR